MKPNTQVKKASSQRKVGVTKRTDVSPKEARIVYARSGGVCAFPDCGKDLVEPGTETDDPSFIGEIGHIIADSRQGPRGTSSMSDEDRDKHPNLILLCRNCHKKVDDQPTVYSVSVLRQIKLDHEARIRSATKPDAPAPTVTLMQETILSSLLPVTHLPDAVFEAKCDYSDKQEGLVKQRLVYPDDETELVRFLIREKKIFTFHDLRSRPGSSGPPEKDTADFSHCSIEQCTSTRRCGASDLTLPTPAITSRSMRKAKSRKSPIAL
jgi:5-methylcytosine-specific restriction endonuclease McrA